MPYRHESREFEPRVWRGVLDAILSDQVCEWLATGWWFSPVDFTNKTDRLDITEILLKVAINTITLTNLHISVGNKFHQEFPYNTMYVWSIHVYFV